MKLPADYDYEGTPAYEEIRAETRQLAARADAERALAALKADCDALKLARERGDVSAELQLITTIDLHFAAIKRAVAIEHEAH